MPSWVEIFISRVGAGGEKPLVSGVRSKRTSALEAEARIESSIVFYTISD
jgi:hypothetical protein